jgi:hypothetical protein
MHAAGFYAAPKSSDLYNKRGIKSMAMEAGVPVNWMEITETLGTTQWCRQFLYDLFNYRLHWDFNPLRATLFASGPEYKEQFLSQK